MTAQAKIETIVDGDEILGGRERHPRLRLWLAPAQHEAQIVADDRHCADTGTLISTIHGRTLELEVELTQGALVVADAEKIAALAAEAQPLVDRVVAGYDTRWDGSNTVGTLTADAREAWDALVGRWDELRDAETWTSDIEVYDAVQWLADGIDGLGISAATTDEELAAMVAEVDSIARADGARLVGDGLEYLTSHRDMLRDDEGDEDDEDA